MKRRKRDRERKIMERGLFSNCDNCAKKTAKVAAAAALKSCASKPNALSTCLECG
jgi:hypothetical protein